MSRFQTWLLETLRDIAAKRDLYRDRLLPRNLYLRETVSDAGANEWSRTSDSGAANAH